MSCPHQMKSSRLCGFGRGHADVPSQTARAVEGCWSTHRRHSVAPRAVLRARYCAAMSQENVEVRRQPDRDRLEQLQARLPGLSGMLLAGASAYAPRLGYPEEDGQMGRAARVRGDEPKRRGPGGDLLGISVSRKLGGAADFYEPDAVIWMHGMGGVGIGEHYRGHEGIRELYADLDDAWGDWAYQVREVVDLADHVAVRADFLGHGRSSGEDALDGVECCHSLGSRQGRSTRNVGRVRWLRKALEAAGPSEEGMSQEDVEICGAH